MAHSSMDVDNLNGSNEDYVLNKARGSLKVDPFEAKSWMLTAQILFPHKFGVQFEAYQIEKSTKNVKEAAKCLSSLLTTFPNEPELLSEVQAMISAVRKLEDAEGRVENAEYLVDLFYQLPLPVQSRLLLSCADKTPDDLEHCKLMLLFFKKFPAGVIQYGPQLMENLITAEKHSAASFSPVNNYRKLLVCDLLPLLCQSNVDLHSSNLYILLFKAIELYLFYIFEPSLRGRKDEGEPLNIDDPWQKLWDTVVNIGTKLGWGLIPHIAGYWNKESYLKAVINYFQTTVDETSQKLVGFVGTLILLRCVHEYETMLEPGNGEPGHALVEAFAMPELSLNIPLKPEEELNGHLLTVGPDAPSALLLTFKTAYRTQELLNSNDYVRNEYMRLNGQLKLDKWLAMFHMDVALYQRRFEEVFKLVVSRKPDSIAYAVTLCSCYYWMANYSAMVDTISDIAGLLCSMTVPGGTISNTISVPTRRTRHLHFLPLTRNAILNYCVTILLAALKEKKSDVAVGHMLVLIQLNWPAECELLAELTRLIEKRGGFSYPIFTNYIINVDILEEFAFLSSDHGSKVPLDVFPAGQQMHSQRRMSTRGVDKGAKEDLKLAIRGQVARSNEPIDELIIRFLKCERVSIQHSLLLAK